MEKKKASLFHGGRGLGDEGDIFQLWSSGFDHGAWNRKGICLTGIVAGMMEV
ncbi:MAG: hypothetical protein QG599_130 [Pseudomonadota bacterium]|nr:hypothetical protein [Pseudomonadota bacterium]